MKTDVSISRNTTFSMAPYEGIRPGVNITVRDVEVEDVEEVYYSLDKLISNLIQLETARMVGYYYEVKSQDSMVEFAEKVSENFEDIQVEIQSSIQQISSKEK